MAGNKYLEKIASIPISANLPSKIMEKVYPYAIGSVVGGATGTVFSNKDTQSASHIGGTVMGAIAGGVLGHSAANLARHNATKALARKADFSTANMHAIREHVSNYTNAGALTGGVLGGTGAAAIQAKRNEKYKKGHK